MRFPLNDIVLFSLMLAVAHWGDGLPLALLSVAQWALGLELISAIVIYSLGFAALFVVGSRGLLLRLLLGLCGLLLIGFFGVVLSAAFHVVVLMLLALMLLAPLTLAIWRSDLQTIEALRSRALVVLGALVCLLLALAYIPFELDFPMSPESRVALGYEPDDDSALKANVAFGAMFYGIVSAVELFRFLWWRLARHFERARRVGGALSCNPTQCGSSQQPHPPCPSARSDATL